jgi:PTS system nitrogen regulatory IIA component
MYLNVIQLAESFGVEESVVEAWIRNEGLPCVTDRRRLLFDRAEVLAWAAQRGLAAKAGFLARERMHSGPGRRLGSLLRTGGIWRDVPAGQVREQLDAVVARLPGATVPVRQVLAGRLHAPDGISWAPVGGGLALPHLRSPVALGGDAGLLAILFLKSALALNEPAPDGVPVTVLLFFIAPSPRAHLGLLAQLGSALTQGNLRRLLLEGAADEQILAALTVAEAAGAGTVEVRT